MKQYLSLRRTTGPEAMLPRRASAGVTRGSAATQCRASSGAIVREVLTKADRVKADMTDDRWFYDFPRLVKHVDDNFLAQVTQLYRERIPAGGAVLDLCSSWVSHLPPDVSYSRVIGHGMNAAELARNKQLSDFFVRNLNAGPDNWALPDQCLDAVVCCVSIQYMQYPERVFAEIYRVLKPGGVAIFTFSNRCFPSKAISAWTNTNSYGHTQLVSQYFSCVEGFTQPEVIKKVELPGAKTSKPGAAAGGSGGALSSLPAALSSLLGKLLAGGGSDPFYAVVAYRNFRREDA